MAKKKVAASHQLELRLFSDIKSSARLGGRQDSTNNDFLFKGSTSSCREDASKKDIDIYKSISDRYFMS